MKCAPILFFAAVACGNSHTSDRGNGTMSESSAGQPVLASATASMIDAASGRTMADSNTVTMTWSPIDIGAIGISVDVFAGEGVAGPKIVEQYMHQQLGPVTLTVKWGKDVGISSYKRTMGDFQGRKISQTTHVSVCSNPGRTVTVRTPDRGAIRAKDRTTRFPAETLTMVEVIHGGGVILFSFVVETDREKEYEAARAHFFASVKCS